jgi:hypothetical protein
MADADPLLTVIWEKDGRFLVELPSGHYRLMSGIAGALKAEGPQFSLERARAAAVTYCAGLVPPDPQQSLMVMAAALVALTTFPDRARLISAVGVNPLDGGVP